MIYDLIQVYIILKYYLKSWNVVKIYFVKNFEINLLKWNKSDKYFSEIIYFLEWFYDFFLYLKLRNSIILKIKIILKRHKS